MDEFTRRSFLGSTGVVLGASKTELQAGQAATESVRWTRTSLPVLRSADVVVAGGSFAGVAAALGFAKAGRKVVLVEPRTYLGREVTATLRPWYQGRATLPDLFRQCTGKQNPYQFPHISRPPEKPEPDPPPPTGGEIPLKLDKVKLTLENALLDAGVELFFASYPVAVCTEQGAVTALIVGNKSGRQALPCRLLVDATETAVAARLAGAEFEPAAAKSSLYHRTVEFENAGAVDVGPLSVPKELGLFRDRVTIHRGYRGPSHVLVALGLEFEAREHGPAEAMRREIEARKRTMRLVAHLVSAVAAFDKAFLTHTSYELHGPYTSRLSGSVPAWAKGLGSLRIPEANQFPMDGFAGPVAGLWCLSEAARLSPAAVELLSDPVGAVWIGEAFAAWAQQRWDRTASPALAPEAAANAEAVSAGELEIREPESPQRGRPYAQFPLKPGGVPVARKVDVLVVGGGSSGATATYIAAKEGVKTLLLEMNPALGGTGTVAAVDSYWFGRRAGFATRLTERVNAVQKTIHYEPEKSNTPRWNIEAKMFTLLRDADEAGAEVLFNTIVTGAIAEGSRVRGVVAATRYGPMAVMAKVVIDASGDGDVAAFAGAENVYCSTMDHIGMWCTLAQFTNPGRNTNHFTSSVDIRNIEDYTRVILAGRRRGNNCHDHGIYVAPRDSRHILSETVLTITDQFRQRRWPDAINIHYSNCDLKGKTTSPWMLSGLIPPNLEVEIPYRILLPKALDNILIAGKAISSNHDGLAGIRMQSDMENLGGIAALSAAKAVKEGKSPRNIDVAELQQRLIAEGLLPRDVLTRRLRPARYGDRDLRKLVDSLLADQPLQAYQDMPMFEVFSGKLPFIEAGTAGPRIVPLLEDALGSPRKVLVAQALAIHGSRAGVPVLIEAIQRAIEPGKVPWRTRRILYIQLPPDQGAMPDVCYLLYNLGMARDKRSLPVWQRVVEILNPKEEEFKDIMRSPFHYVDSVCYGAERLGDPAAVSILEQLHAYPCLRDQITRKGFQPDYLKERQAMCELSIAKALARCGSAAGVALMIDYLEDNRATLAEQSHSQLIRITGRDYGKHTGAWRSWLDRAKGTLEPRPLVEDLDIVYESDILIS